MKILTTAVFSVLLMGRRFHARKWRALVLLVLGVTLVSNGSLPGSSSEGEDGESEGDDAAKVNAIQYVIGVAAVLTEVCVCVRGGEGWMCHLSWCEVRPSCVH